MKKIALITILLISNITLFSQKTISKLAISEFSNACTFQVRFNQNNNFLLSTLMQGLAAENGGINQAYTILVSTEIDSSARNKVFKGFYKLSGSDQSKLFMYLFDWGLNSKSAKEIADYISHKFSVIKSSELFEGEKIFTDNDGWIYKVKISGNNIEIKLFPSASNNYYPDKRKPHQIITGTVKNGKIITRDKSFKYENGKFYELNNEGTWNEYVEK